MAQTSTSRMIHAGNTARNIGTGWRSLACLTLMVALAWLGALPVYAASPMLIFVPQDNDESTNLDDTLITRPLSWKDDAVDGGVRWILYAQPVFERVIPPNRIFGREDITNNPFELFPDARIAAEIKDAIERAIEQWNNLPTSSFRFQPNVTYSFNVFTNDITLPFGPETVGLDGYNLITFSDPDFDYTEFDEDTNFATTVVFYARRDFDLTDNSNLGGTVRVIGVEQGNDEENETLIIDFDGDGVEDLRLDRREYLAGEILDTDIIFNQASQFALWPEDASELGTINPPTTEARTLGTPDIQTLVTRQLGFAIGGDSSLIPTSVMYNAFQTDFDFLDDDGDIIDPGTEDPAAFRINPFEARDLSQQLDVQVLGAILYPASGTGRGTISGTIYRGSAIDGGRVSFGTSGVIPQKPVYVGRPVSTQGQGSVVVRPNDILSNRGFIRLEANVLSGLDQVRRGSTSQSLLFFRENGRYSIPGLPPAVDYGVRIDGATGLRFNTAPDIRSDVFTFYANSDEGEAEWYGGAGLTPVMTEENLIPQVPNTSIVNAFLNVDVEERGTIFGQITNAERFVFPDSPMRYRIVLADNTVLEGIVDPALNEAVALGAAETDTAALRAVRTFLIEGRVQLTATYTIEDLQSAGRAADLLIRFSAQNVSSQPITFSLRFDYSMGWGRTYADLAVPATGNSPVYVGNRLLAFEESFQPAPASFEMRDHWDSTRQIVRFFLGSSFGMTPPDRYVIGSLFNIVRDGNDFQYDPLGSPFYNIFGDETAGGADDGRIRTFDHTSILYWNNRTIAPQGILELRTGFGVVAYERIPETSQPFNEARPTFLGDDPLVSEPVRVVANGITGHINIITNDGAVISDPPGTDPGGPGGPGGPGAVTAPRPNDELPTFDDGNQNGTVLPIDRLIVFGAGVGDYDNDGDLDIYLCVGARTDDPDNPLDNVGLANRFYKNMWKETGQVRFVDITFGPDLLPGTSDDFIPLQQDSSYHATFGDFDRDGWADIYVSNVAGPAGEADSVVGRQNRLLMNRERTRNGVTERYFVDATDDFLPGILNNGPNNPLLLPLPSSFPINEGNLVSGSLMFDISTRSAIGDIDSDGDLDIVVSNAQFGADPLGSFGLYGPVQLDAPEVPKTANLFWSERVLINTLVDENEARNGQFGFVDETLGVDGIFGVGPETPVTNPNLTTRSNDRLPPLYANIRANDSPVFDFGNNEQDASDSSMVLLAPLDTVGSALDIFIANRRPVGNTISNGFPAPSSTIAGRDMTYQNIDIDGDRVPDGYFRNITGGNDFSVIIGPDDNRQGHSVITLPGTPAIFQPAGGVVAFNPFALYSIFDGDNGDAIDPESDFYPRRLDDTQYVAVIDRAYAGYNEVLKITTYNDGLGPAFLTRSASAFVNRADNGVIGGAAAAFVNDTAAVLDRPGAETWLTHQDFAGGGAVLGRPRAAAVADFNLDGDPDVVTASDLNSTSGPYLIFTGAGGDGFLQYWDNSNTLGGFTEASIPLGFFEEELRLPYIYLHAADFDNDGDDDLLALSLGTGVRVFFNGTIGGGVNPISNADFPMFFDASSKFLPPFFSTIFVPEVTPGELNSTTSVDFADLTGNGFIDIAVGRGAYLTVQGDVNSIFLNLGAQLYNSGQRIFKPIAGDAPAPRLFSDFDPGFGAAPRNPTSWVRMADLNGNGAPDIFMTNYGTPNQLFLNIDSDDVTLNSLPDDNEFPDGVTINRTSDRLPSFSQDERRELSQHFAYGDFNGDGLLDIIIANGPNVQNTLLLNSVPQFEPNVFGGNFLDATANLPALEDDTIHVVVSDFNGDGHLDIFVLNRYRTTITGGVEVETSPHSRMLFNNGNGTFTDVTWGADGIAFTSDDFLPLITGTVTAAVAADFDLAGDPTEDLNGNGIIESHEIEWIEKDGAVQRYVRRKLPANPGDPEPAQVFTPSYDLFITRADGTNLLLRNDGTGRMVQADLPSRNDASFAVDAGNISLRSARASVIDPNDPTRDIEVDRPLIDIIVGNQSTANIDNSITFWLNDASAPGTFINRSAEVPIFTSTLLTPPDNDSISGNIRAVRLADVDNDGDLDLYLGQFGQIGSGTITGATDILMLNRTIGDNLHAQTIVGQQLGIVRPRLTFASPAASEPGTVREVHVHGAHFENGTRLDFGPGIEVLRYISVTPSRVAVEVRIAPDAAVGPRTVTAAVPSGFIARGEGIFAVGNLRNDSASSTWIYFE